MPGCSVMSGGRVPGFTGTFGLVIKSTASTEYLNRSLSTNSVPAIGSPCWSAMPGTRGNDKATTVSPCLPPISSLMSVTFRVTSADSTASEVRTDARNTPILERVGRTMNTPMNPATSTLFSRVTRGLVVPSTQSPPSAGLNGNATLRLVLSVSTVDTAVDAMKAGAYDYLTKPVHPDEMSVVVRRALEHVHLVEQVRTLRLSLNKKYGFENILGRSDVLLEALDTAERAAHSNSTVLIRGETGTGKELLARAIHFNSSRRDNPLVTINCGAIPKELLESELFGHRRGAFTGAVADKKGRIERADGGTVFLDEIAELSPDLQVKLLRLVQEGETEKVGSEVTAKVNVRIIAATHRELQAMIEDGTFREDLYYRLAVIPLVMPPLRERSDDIPDLVEHFFREVKRKTRGRIW
jgi:transcriptional regulator with GAF, ATPase, and Fis domain